MIDFDILIKNMEDMVDFIDNCPSIPLIILSCLLSLILPTKIIIVGILVTSLVYGTFKFLKRKD